MSTTLPDLKACPFCGGEAERKNEDRPHGGMVNCKRCGAEAFGPKWNSRSYQLTPEEVWEIICKMQSAPKEQTSTELDFLTSQNLCTYTPT